MRPVEARAAAVAVLLQAGEPLAEGEVAGRAGLTPGEARQALEALLDDRQVACGRLRPDCAGTTYRWAARLAAEVEAEAVRHRERVRWLIAPPGSPEMVPPDIEGEAASTFHSYVTEKYAPPAGKEWLVLLQCSVRRPFSSAPSHAAMRRAVETATGHDPAGDFGRCPVHVVVLASFVGPVPYELEDTYPANVRAGGVKHMDDATYSRVGRILAERVAGYLTAHGGHYTHIAAFADGRYAEVLSRATRLAERPFAILPSRAGPYVMQLGRSRPRKYWERYWIQLYQEIERWLRPAQREAARKRLAALAVTLGGAE